MRSRAPAQAIIGHSTTAPSKASRRTSRLRFAFPWARALTALLTNRGVVGVRISIRSVAIRGQSVTEQAFVLIAARHTTLACFVDAGRKKTFLRQLTCHVRPFR